MIPRTCALLALLATVTTSAHAQPGWVFLEDDVSPPFAVSGTFRAADGQAYSLRLAACGDDRENLSSYYLLEAGPGRCAISLVSEGDASLLAEAAGPPLAAGADVAFSVHRDGWRIALLLNGMTVVKAWDTTLQGGVFGYLGGSGLTVTDAFGQEIGELSAADTFEREEGAKDDWTVRSGAWEHVSLREDRQAGQMQADKTTNAFSYSGRGKGGVGLTTSGAWWWRNCAFGVAVRCRGTDSAAGLSFYVQDERNYMVLRAANRMSEKGQSEGLALMAVRDGKAEVLARCAGAVLPDQWYRLRVTVCDDRARCYVDDELALDVGAIPFGQGPIGMYVEGADGASFDDMAVTKWDEVQDLFGSATPARWEGPTDWAIREGAVHWSGREAGAYVTGDPAWSSCIVSARATGLMTAPGLVAGYQSADDYYVFRWANSAGPPGVAGRAQLVHVTAEGEKLLQEASLPADPPDALEARLEVAPGLLAGFLGQRQVVDAPVDAPVEGRTGVYAQGEGTASFAAFSVEPLPERRVARVVKEFTDTKEHFEMAEWASTRHAWVQPKEKEPGAQVWWTKGDYYGPLEVRVPLAKVGAISGTAVISLLGEQDDDALCQVHVAATAGSASLAVTIRQSSVDLGAATADAAGDEAELVVSVAGRCVEVSLDGALVLQVLVPAQAGSLVPSSTATGPAAG